MHIEQQNSRTAWKLHSRIPTLCKYTTEKEISEKLGLAIGNSVRDSFLSLRMNNWLLSRIKEFFWNPGVLSNQLSSSAQMSPRIDNFFPSLHLYSMEWTGYWQI